MRVFHLNCGSLCPFGGALWDGQSGVLGRGELVCHCLLIETDRSLVLVDTGLGVQDCRDPFPRLSRVLTATLGVRLDEHRTAITQVRALGYDPRDVEHIVLTHLDFDHAGGLDDFTEATLHLYAPERDAATQRKTAVQRGRYRPLQWSGERKWALYESIGERWLGLECVRELIGLPSEILLVPLVGHTLGHAGVAILHDGHWLLHAGDAYLHRDEMARAYGCPPGLALYQRAMDEDAQMRRRNLSKLRQLATSGENLTVFCAHDAVELARLQTLNPPPRPRVATLAPPLFPEAP
jgi:glyoxylase-like metal-dependent hydrolase (beta-lactamase superfamily II)